MIIVDFSNLAISSLFAIKSQGHDFTEDYFRHVVLNSLRKVRKQFRDYGEVVIAVDAANSWRKEVFPYYKASRKKSRESSDIDWNFVYSIIAKLVEELRNNFPYKVIKIDRCEADDVIGTLVFEKHSPIASSDNKHNIIIISSDKDMIQLQFAANVKQYDPIKEKWIIGNGKEYLFEQILRGDVGDGIPNYLSVGSSFVEKIRQKPVMQKKVDEFKKIYGCDLTSEFKNKLIEMGVLDNFIRNKTLIDLNSTPDELHVIIMSEYNKEPAKNNLINYFREYKLKILFDHINEF